MRIILYFFFLLICFLKFQFHVQVLSLPLSAISSNVYLFKRGYYKFYKVACLRVMFLSVNPKSMLGVFNFSVAVINISLILGIPRVTLAPPCPAKWNVFKVI